MLKSGSGSTQDAACQDPGERDREVHARPPYNHRLDTGYLQQGPICHPHDDLDAFKGSGHRILMVSSGRKHAQPSRSRELRCDRGPQIRHFETLSTISVL